MDLRQTLSRLAKADFADALGVSIADRSIALAHVRKRFNTVTVPAVETRELDAPPEGRWALIIDFIREFMGAHALDAARVSVALERRAALMGHLQLPATAVENIDSVVQYELDRIIPAPADQLYPSHYWRSLGTAGERVSVCVVAGLRERVDEAYAELAAAGIDPSAITVTPVALNDYYYFCRAEEAAIAGIFHREGERESLTLSSDGLLVSTASFDAGREERADRLAREIESLVPDRADEPVEMVIEGEDHDGAVDLAGIAPLDLVDDGTRPSWLEAAAIGAGLGQLGEAKAAVNLLPGDLVKTEEGIGLRELSLAAVVVIMAAALAGSIAVKNLSVGSALAVEVERLEPEVERVTGREEENRQLMSRVELLEKPRSRSVLAYLKAMTEAVPKTAYLTTFRYKGDRLEVDGIAENASGLIAVLERSPYFENVEFTAPTTKYLQSQERFSLRMELER